MLDTRTILMCAACAARAPEQGILPRVIVDHELARGTFQLLGCPLCSGPLTAERMEPLAIAAPPSAADLRAAALASTRPAPPPARSSPPPASPSTTSPSTRPPNGDFIQMPSRAKCAKCEATFTFPVSEPMTDAIKRVGWHVDERGGVICPKHDAAAEHGAA